MFWYVAVPVVETQASFSPNDTLGEEYADISSEQAQQMINSMIPEVVLLVLSFPFPTEIKNISEYICNGRRNIYDMQHKIFC